MNIDGAKYIQELELLSKAINDLDGEITTWHGRHIYSHIKSDVDCLLELNKEHPENARWMLNY